MQVLFILLTGKWCSILFRKNSITAITKLSQSGLLNCLVYTFANINDNNSNLTVRDFTHILELAKEYGARWVIYHGFIPYSKNKEKLKADPKPQATAHRTSILGLC